MPPDPLLVPMASKPPVICSLLGDGFCDVQGSLESPMGCRVYWQTLIQLRSAVCEDGHVVTSFDNGGGIDLCDEQRLSDVCLGHHFA